MRSEPGSNSAPHGILENISCHLCHGFTPFLLGAQDMIEGLALPAGRLELVAQIAPKELDGDSLIRVRRDPSPKQVRVVGHQYVGRADEPVTRRSVNKDKLPGLVELGCEPSGCTVLDGEGPKNDSRAPVVFPSQPRQMSGAVRQMPRGLQLRSRVVGHIRFRPANFMEGNRRIYSTRLRSRPRDRSRE